MTIQTAPERLVVAVQTGKELDSALDKAHEALQPAAMTERVGILVTRLAAGSYEVRLNAGLPPGTTMESWGASSDEPR